ncbi:hypothetical protein B9G54_03690 [Alloscardovia macacae]|uniref:DUF4352 domain-containing protein n=1 Tax=Alloscardovia macacae TaxID=1160091 RepID=A0A1Y2SXS1_9BIFI|nr:hypothetical protein [Alloscardovia macacae]OTA26690.1 hypothetical protein B9G54_03690 [Alloscardovia macacae]OTA29556.1 hypothetical protein B9T39_02840 [Alloscardovia macacae]
MKSSEALNKTVTLKLWHIVIAVCAVMLLIVGCTFAAHALATSHNEATTAKNNYPRPTKQEAPKKTTPQKSARGNIIKHIGETAAACSDQNCSTPAAQWTVTNITIDATCTGEYATAPENGHFVALDIDASVSSSTDASLYLGASGGWWTYFTKDGTQLNLDPRSGASLSCVSENEALPSQISTGAKASGKVILDVPSTDGYLVYSMDGTGKGWEYPLS